MYRINTPTETYLTEHATWVKPHPSGSAYLLCDQKKAAGVMYQGKPYLYQDGCSVEEVDMGKPIYTMEKTVSDNDAMNVDQEYRLTLLELGLTE